MNLSVIQPVRFWVDSLSIQSNVKYTGAPEMGKAPRLNLNFGVSEAGDPVGQTLYRCQVRLEIAPETDDDNLPYELSIAVSGVFVFPPEARVAPEQQHPMVALNGIALTYGFARDVVLHHTAVAAHGVFMLPTLDLTDVRRQLGPPWNPSTEGEQVSGDDIPTDRLQPTGRTRRRRQSQT